jgi:hypothetical protein
MVTDGLSTMLIVSRPKQAKKEVTTASEKKEKERVKGLFENADCVVSVIPGRNPIWTALVHDQHAMDSLQDHNPTNVKHEVLTWSRRQFYQEVGYSV